jgi:hypothetical protein
MVLRSSAGGVVTVVTLSAATNAKKSTANHVYSETVEKHT